MSALTARRGGLFAVVADGLNRAAFKGFHAERDIVFGLRLLMDKGITTFVVTAEKRRRGFAAQVTIDALLIDVELTSGVLLPFVCFVSHVSARNRNDFPCQETRRRGIRNL